MDNRVRGYRTRLFTRKGGLVLNKRTFIPLPVILLVAAVFIAGCFGKPAQENTAVTAELGIVDLPRAVQAHPEYQQLLTLKKELNTIVARMNASRPSGALPQTGPLPDNTALNTALEQEYQEKMTARQAQLRQELAAKAEEKHKQLVSELEDYRAEVDREYQPQIFNLQLKLKTVQLTAEQMTALQAELEQLQQARSEKLLTKEKELTGRMEAAMAPEQTKIEQQLAAYASQLQADLSRQAALKSAEIAARHTEQGNSNAAGAVDDELAQQAGSKRQEIAALEQSIIQAVRDKAAQVAAERGLDSVIANIRMNINAVDITEAVIAGLRNK